MSFETLLWVRTQKTGNCASRSVLRVLADHAGQDHSCYLRTRLIASETDLSEAGVRKALARLIDAGLVRVFSRYDDSGKRISNRYQIMIDGAETPWPDAEDWADLRERDTLHDGDGDPAPTGGATLSEGEGLPVKEATKNEAPLKGGASQPKSATRVPDDFQPTEEMRAWFVAEQLPAVIDGRLEHEKFMDYWRAAAGANARKRDWPATWRNWMRRAAQNAAPRPWRPGNAAVPISGAPYRPGQSTTDDRVMQGLALVQQFRLEEENKA